MPLDDQSELFYWVDENDQVISSITRAEAHSGTNKIHRGVGIFIFIPDYALASMRLLALSTAR